MTGFEWAVAALVVTGVALMAWVAAGARIVAAVIMRDLHKGAPWTLRDLLDELDEGTVLVVFVMACLGWSIIPVLGPLWVVLYAMRLAKTLANDGPLAVAQAVLEDIQPYLRKRVALEELGDALVDFRRQDRSAARRVFDFLWAVLWAVTHSHFEPPSGALQQAAVAEPWEAQARPASQGATPTRPQDGHGGGGIKAPRPDVAVYELLLELFTVDELRALLWRLDAEMIDAIPGGTTTPCAFRPS